MGTQETEVEGTTPDNTEESATLSPAEEKAITAGWVPESEWQGEAGEWVSAKDFNFRGELMGRISEQSSIIKHLESKVSTRDEAIDDLQNLQTKITEKAYKDAMRDLKQKKVEALDLADNHKVVQIDEEISELKANKPAEQPTQQRQVAPETPKEVLDWLEAPKNQWYNKDEVMRSMADGISNNILKNSPNITPAALLQKLDQTIRQELPHKFKGQSSVDEGGSQLTSNQTRGSKQPTFADLSEEQQQVAKRFASIGVMTKKEYIAELVAAGEL